MPRGGPGAVLREGGRGWVLGELFTPAARF